MTEMNVFKWIGYSRRYYLTHPWKWVRQKIRSCKFAWQRITKGYCSGDVWDLDLWLLEILPKMLDDLANCTCSYPGYDEFDTPEKWNKALHNLANDLRLCTEDAAEKMNEYSEEFYNNCHLGIHNKELSNKFFERGKEIAEEQKAIRENTFMRLAELLPSLWD